MPGRSWIASAETMISVAAYCRVSTDGKDQANSFDTQRRYFREYIDRQPQWALYDIYADEGITGTSTKRRTAFNRMICDAHAGKFRLILTKEVSRFSRNLLDTIAYTRELKALGIGVLFMNDGFSSLDPDSELRLSIMGSIAQEESRKTSTRVKWGQQRQMERGIVFGTSMLGYDVRAGKLTVNPEGAEIVRLIFQKYAAEGKGAGTIARELREAGFLTYSGGTHWSSTQVLRILRNEKYVGDLVQKKTITPDYLSHAKKINRGEEAQVKIPNHHQPIVDRDLWDAVQQRLQSQSSSAQGHSNRHVFSGKIRCGQCGGTFVARRKTRKSGSSYLRWGCYNALTSGCGIGKTLRDELAMELLARAIRSVSVDFESMEKHLTGIVFRAMEATGPSHDPDRIREEERRIRRKKEGAIDAYLCGTITAVELQAMKERYDTQLAALESIPAPAPHPNRENLRERIHTIITCQDPPEPLCRLLVKQLTIRSDGTLDLELRHLPTVWHFRLCCHRTNRHTEQDV